MSADGGTSETYVERLERIAGSVPQGPCILALVPTVTPDHAAGLASDLARVVARRRDGHTLLFSLEDAPARLDHEIGVEGGAGLTDVIEGRLALARAAASGRARGFIYIPAGREPTPGVDVVRSPAWRSLADSAVRRGGTVVAYMPREVLEAARGAANEPTARIDGVVWLGPEPADVVWLPWRILGSIDLPDLPDGGARRPDAGPGGRVDRGDAPDDERSDASAERRGGGASGRPHAGAPVVVRGASRRARRERERRRRRLLVAAMIVAFVAALALAAFALVGPDPREAFLPENDSLWSSPADSAGTSPGDSGSVAPESDSAAPDTSGT